MFKCRMCRVHWAVPSKTKSSVTARAVGCSARGSEACNFPFTEYEYKVWVTWRKTGMSATDPPNLTCYLLDVPSPYLGSWAFPS